MTLAFIALNFLLGHVLCPKFYCAVADVGTLNERHLHLKDALRQSRENPQVATHCSTISFVMRFKISFPGLALCSIFIP